ncbi:hypothetical protein LIS82_05090 [Cytobacillus solani]|uniref:hypothetical protein n=1 Tax=Cytobacillus solani TaxID=1637975 RepID=UPI0006ABB8C6|nr:hypothetical protein [Cytobacillus solani]KOP70976.1 hypothetical protein AMS60_23250 [Bacillus sp. FJAT-21945]USK55907.1 hypothetical protein LIS82_05090 [Cytobacillus solani]
MIELIYRDNQIVGTIQPYTSFEWEIEHNVIPNYGGVASDYKLLKISDEDYIKFNSYEFTIENGNIFFGAKKPQEETTKEPTPLEIIQEDLNDVAVQTAQNTEDVMHVAETVAYNLEDSTALGEALALALTEIENLKTEIANLKGV